MSGAVTLARDGTTRHVIVVAADAPAPERTAGVELAEHLNAATGVTFRVVEEAPAGAPAIFVGLSPRVRALWPDLDPAALGHDGIAIRTVGDDLILAGQPPRGTLYAVYTFLEDQVGIRWWSSTEQTIPARPTLEIGPLNQTYAPPLRVREAFYRDAQEGVFSARLKLNGHFHRVPAEYGGHYEILGWCHTFYQLLPPDRYFAEHPDWYSELNGRRTANGGQLCLTNAEMRAELVRQALGWIEKNPAAGMISIAQNDWHGACQCAACQAIVREEGSESGPLIRFVNAVAEEIEKHYPDFLIETLAYAYTRSAPRVTRPRDNVVVRLCSIECSWSQTLAEGAQNRPFRRDLEAWSAVAPKLYIWDYVTNFPNAMFPHPNLHVLADNVRTFVRHHTIGLFEQGDAYCSAGDFVRLRAWLLAHLMWDPSRDDAALIDEYLRGYYGPAAAPLAEYLSLRTEAVVRAGTYLRCFTDETASWLDLPTLNRATELFDQAEAAVRDDAVLLARVQRERLPLDLVWLLRGEGLRLQAQRDGAAYRGPTDFRAATEQFLERCAANKVEFRGEGRPFAPLADQLRARLRDPAPPPPDVAGLPAAAWQDFPSPKARSLVPGAFLVGQALDL
ncbi:MAG: DUF4838 domain-containing protein, partial [Rubrivivax sp.]|nr:DUF4838 domain-containing protein [Rubrivivax sp.]